jgi:hypothetical protein
MTAQEIYNTLHEEKISFQQLMHAINSAVNLFEEESTLVVHKAKYDRNSFSRRYKSANGNSRKGAKNP